MLYLHVSNKTENLLQHLVEVSRSVGRRNPFEKEFFLIQSQGMERVISQAMADYFTSWCNFEFLLPMQFLSYCTDKLGLQISGDQYDRQLLEWRIDEILRHVDDSFGPLPQYLSGENRELKRFQLAGQLAYLFDQYQLMRPEMVESWDRGMRLSSHIAEDWQMKIWQLLRDQLPGEVVHRGELLARVIGALRDSGENSAAGVLPARLNVFGLTIMAPMFLKFLESLAVHIDIHLYVLSPCKHYWGDISRKKKVQLPLSDIPDTDAFAIPESHPLLVSLGQQGRDFQQLLFDDIHYELQFTSYDDPAGAGESSLLNRLQSDLLKGEVARHGTIRDRSDESIQIVSCHSRMRELGVLKEYVQSWLYNDPDLQLRDIVVMAPDIQEYSNFIPAVFEDIHHSISDRSLHRRNSIISSFSQFLHLFKGRFGWEEMLDVLQEQGIADNFNLSVSDLESIRVWVLESGIRWGLSGAHRQEMELPGLEESTWSNGLNRMLMGYAIDGGDFVDGILPYTEIEGSYTILLGELCSFIEIVEEAYAAFKKTYSLRHWVELLQDYCDRLFSREGKQIKELLELQKLLADLAESTEGLHYSRVDFTVICEWLDRVTRETRTSSGFLQGQLTFCSMLPMRSIPFKHVCLIGLNEGEFPKSDRNATFDLMADNHRPGDRSRRMDDRYLFLEALLAARKRLYISYVGQSIRTNDDLAPSVVVADLLELLGQEYNFKGESGDIVIKHPLQPFNSRYFKQDEKSLFSYDESFCRVAEKLSQAESPSGLWWQGKRDVEITEVSWQELLRFYSHPQRFFIRDCLGINLFRTIGKIPQSEPFGVDGLELYQLDQELLARIIEGAGEEDLLTKLQINGRWPLGAAGTLSFNRKIEELRAFSEKIISRRPGESVDSLPIDLDVDGVRLHGRLGNIHEEGVLLYRYTRLKEKDLLQAYLYHLLYALVTGQSGRTVLLAKDRCIDITDPVDGEYALQPFMTTFVEGCRRPGPFFLEAGFAGTKAAAKGDDFNEAAVKRLIKDLGSGYANGAEFELLLQEMSPEHLIEPELEALCNSMLTPVMRYW